MIKIYDILDHEGYLIAESLTVEEAADEIMTSDGREWEIREDKDGGFTAWTRQQVANRPWSATAVYSFAATRAEAEREICQKIVESERWPGHPEAIERDARLAADAQFAREEFAGADREELTEWIKAQHNCQTAIVDDAGGIWIEGPQIGHWLGTDDLIALRRRWASTS